MCGFLFIKAPLFDRNEFKVALELLNHRGPDNTGYFFSEKVALGHKRLKILDLSEKSNQPFFSEKDDFVLIYNGEIYNYKELADKYRIELSFNSDTELLMKLYLLLGEKMLTELNGMFAFVIYNIKLGTYFAARDRLGVKPLFIYEKNDEVILASEIAPIVHSIKNYSLDEIGLRQYKKLRGFFNGHTIYKEVKQFPAGCYSINGKVFKYWSLKLDYQDNPSDDKLRFLIESAIQYRKISDVSVGSFLSGGLDSSIVASISKIKDTWTIGFEYENEFSYSREVSEFIGSSHHEIIVGNEEFLETAKWMIRERRDVLCVPNEVLIYLMAREVKKNNTVILCGEGADEMFLGYDRIFKWANTNDWSVESSTVIIHMVVMKIFEIVEYALEPFTKIYTECFDIVYSFFQTAHLNNLLKRLDSATMLASVEAREPFVDYRLIERLSGVAFSYKMKGDIVKYPLKNIFKVDLPTSVLNRKKVGFPVDLNSIFGNKELGSQKVGFDFWFNFNLNCLNE